MGIKDIKQTHTYVTLEVSQAAYNEIATKLREAGYDHVFGDDGEIDMHGLALVYVGSDGIVREPPPDG